LKAVILAAGVGSRLAPLTADRPKVLVEVAGRSFLLRQLDRLAEAGIAARDVVVVGGYRIDQIRAELARADRPCKLVMNERFDTWQNFYSLLVAAPELSGADFLQLDGDVLLDEALLPSMIASRADAALAVDRGAELDDDAMKVQLDERGRVVAVSKQLQGGAGEYLGIAKLTAAAAREVFADLGRFPALGLTHEYYDHSYHRLADRVGFEVVDAGAGAVIEIDDLADLRRAEALLARA
jgi:choline kinase